ncbi:hypothetical protein EYF88_13795 [Paracoccus sediminis]|uniref:Uncharacterized protein n=1 Tax=Paracoccus sediminis TaxID=1214787 RepID=A0A238XKN4_9RHOB|nr:hypothetical protein [Paracoccus sediminis]TBN48566.1 hypothetical protein EYF88_13795 [Paracoccus sediminis]SNR59128.1 hypothetical protein SAMN06265378_110115 [Paracoccus sediminis]
MSFGRDLKRLAQEAKANMLTIARASVEDVFEQVQTPRDEGGRMPVESGDLRNSLTMKGGGKGAESYKDVVRTMQLGDVVEGHWDIPYAMVAEFGGKNPDGTERPGNFMVTGAAFDWEQTVERNGGALKK